MQVRSCRPTCRSFECDRCSTRHDLPGGEPRSVSGEMAVVGRVAIPVDDHQEVSITHAARVEGRHTRVSGDDLRAIWAGDVASGVDLVRIRAAGLIDLEVEAGAAEPLTHTPRAAVRLGPFEYAVAAAGLHR